MGNLERTSKKKDKKREEATAETRAVQRRTAILVWWPIDQQKKSLLRTFQQVTGTPIKLMSNDLVQSGVKIYI